jgi:hypothetical protein
MLQSGSNLGGSGADFRPAVTFLCLEIKLVDSFVLESCFIYAGADWSNLSLLSRGTVLPAESCESWVGRAGFGGACVGRSDMAVFFNGCVVLFATLSGTSKGSVG